jgi:hypothetical protein
VARASSSHDASNDTTPPSTGSAVPPLPLERVSLLLLLPLPPLL